MKKLTSIIISIVFFAEGMMFYNHYSYAHHVNQAKGEMIYLQSLLEGDKKIGKGLKASVLEAFNIEINENENEIRLKNLSKKIVDSTEYAIENADDIKKVSKLKKAIDEINELQTNSIDIIKNTMQKIEDESVNNEVGVIYNTAIDLKKKVNHASAEIQTAIDNNQKKIEINIHTSKDKKHHGEEIKEEEHEAKRNATDVRVEKKKEEDKIQRNANIERIKLIEQGKESQRSQELARKMEQAQIERAKRENS